MAYDLEAMMGEPEGKNNSYDLKSVMGEPEGKDDGFLGNIKKGFVSGGAGVFGGIADMVHADGVGDYFNGVVENNQRSKNYDSIFSMDYLTDPSGLTYGVSNQLGSMAALLPAALAAPESAVGAGAAGATRLLAGLGSRRAAQWAASEAGQTALKLGARGAMTSVPESMSEGGNTRRDMLDNGSSESDATLASAKVFGENMATLPISNGLEYMLIGGKLFKPTAGIGENLATRVAKAPLRVAPAAGAGATQQGVEELLQQTYQDSAEGNPVGNPLNPYSWTDNQKMAFQEGMAGSLVLGGAAGGYRATRKNSGADLGDIDVSNIEIPENIQAIIDSGLESPQQDAPTEQAAPQGQKFYSVSDEVSDTGLSGGTEQKLNNLSAAFQQQFGEPLNVTSMKRHGDGSSWHDSGQAFDIAGGMVESSPEARQWLMDNASKYGLVGLDEYANPSANATGGHIHFSDHEGGEGSGGAQGKFGYNIAEMIAQKDGLNPDLVWAQMYHETGGFDSALAKEDHNYAGIKNPDGSYRHFDSDEEFADYQARNLAAYKEDGLFDAKTPEEYAAALKHGGYFSDSTDNYANGMRSALKGNGGVRSSYDSKNSSSSDEGIFSDKIIDFADYMRNTSDDPETINFFEDKFNAKDRFIDTEKNRQDIQQQYAEQFKQWQQQQQAQPDIQMPTPQAPVNQSPAPQAPQVKQPVQQQPITIKTPALDNVKVGKMLSDPKMTALAGRALQGDAAAIKALNTIPQQNREALMQHVQNMAHNPQETAQQTKTGQPIQDIGQQKGEAQNESTKSTVTETAQNINPENQVSNAVSRQGNVQTEAQINPSPEEVKNVGDYLSALQQEKENRINQMVGFYQKNPGGKGTNTGTVVDGTGRVTGRFSESNNPAWYQQYYKEYGKKPTKVGLREFAEKQLQVDPHFRMIDDEIKSAQKHLDKITQNTAQTSQEAPRQEKATKRDKVPAQKNKVAENVSSEEVQPTEKAPQQAEKEQPIQTPAQEEKTAQANADKTTAANKNDAGRFGSEQEAEDEMLKAFGKEKKTESKKTFNVIDDSDDALQKALKEFSSEISNVSSTPMFNPKLMTAAFKIGMIHLQRGLNNFADWSKEMIQTSPQLKPFLNSVWDSVNAYPKEIKFDENKMSAVMRYVGTQYDKGMTDKEALKNQLVKMIGKEYAELIEPAYAGVAKFPAKEAIKNELYDSTSGLAARTSQGPNQNTVGQDDASGGTSTGRGQRIQPTGKPGDSTRSGKSIHGRSTSTGGKTGDSAVQAKESENNTDSTGSVGLSGSVIDSLEGQSLLDNGRTGRDIEPPQNGRNNATDLKTSKAEKQHPGKFKAGVLKEIKDDLPMLLPEQAEDIAFAEKRLLENAGTGVLFTNGTGTGKTFTGLGVIKRFMNRGKNNILIVTPSAKINSEWIKAAKKFFGIDVSELKNTKDAGNGAVITTYANMGANNALVKREWDLIIPDESQTLMSGEGGKSTAALDNLRAITMNPRGFGERFNLLHQTEYQRISDMPSGDEKRAAYDKLSEQRRKSIAEWEQASEGDKPKVTFLSATPFAYVPNIDYAEGYLFKYPGGEGSAYNSGSGRDRFYMSHFGYRMRYNKLTKPEASVNNSVMEVQFHEQLRKDGALSGRALTVDKDYDRGFILVDGGVGKKIDEGFTWLNDKRNGFTNIAEFLQEHYKGNQKDYLLEAIKAKESIPLIKKYLASGKKVVLFHGYKKGGAAHPFRIENIPSKLAREYEAFKRTRPDLVNLDLKGLTSPLVTLQKEFGNKLLMFNGDVSKKNRELAVKEFNDDNSSKNLIVVQQDAGQAGISLHDRTGKHQRVLINLGMPTKPVAAIQIEGRIYRVGQQSNAIFRYLNTGTMMERMAFANKIAERASTAENLALGAQARDLKNSFISAFEETMDGNEWKRNLPGMKGEGTGGKEKDSVVSNAASDFDKAKTYYYAQQKKNARTKAAEGVDYFATPEPLGYKMVEWANLKPGDSVLEPSAGHGAIARFFPGDTKNVAIEPSGDLVPRIKMAMDGGDVINTRFEDYYVGNKFNAVVMNPPFGAGGKTAIEHVAKAFKHLKDSGRLVAIIPDGPSCQKHLEKWLYGNDNADKKVERGEPDAFLMKTISLPGVAFERAGTKVRTKVIIIDKQETEAGKEAAAAYAGSQYDVSADNINELFDNIENMSAPAYQVKGNASAQQEASQQEENPASESSFKTADHLNTKTGVPQYKAVFKKYVGKDAYKNISSLAKRNSGYYSKFANGFLFENESDRGAFIKEADAVLAANPKMSAANTATAPVERMRMGIEYLSDNELSAKEKDLQEVGKQMGVPIIYFDGDPNLRGFHSHGITFLNRKGNLPINWTFWHETFHWLKANNQQLYRDMLDHISQTDGFTQQQVDEYRNNIGRPELSNDEAIEEMLADAMPDVRRRVTILKNLGKENKSLAERFVAWVRDTMDRFHEFLKSPLSTTTDQQQAMTTAFAKLAGDMVDSSGKRIFRVNKTKREILLANGEPLSAKYSIDNSDNLGDNDGNKRENKLTNNISIDADGNVSVKLKYPVKPRETQAVRIARRKAEVRDIDSSLVSKGGRSTYVNLLPNSSKADIDERISNGESPKEISLEYRHKFNSLLANYSDTMPENKKIGFLLVLKGAEYYASNRTKTDTNKTRNRRFFENGNERSGDHESQQKEETETVTDKHSEKGAFSMPEDDVKYSAISSSVKSLKDRALNMLADKIKTKPLDNVSVQKKEQDGLDSLGIKDVTGHSPSWIADHHKFFKPIFARADAASELQESLRNDFSKQLKEINKLLKNKQDRDDVNSVIVEGDLKAVEFSTADLKARELSDNAMQAYFKIRNVFDRLYELANEARMQARSQTKHLSEDQLNDLKKNKFVEIQKITPVDKAFRVTYKAPKFWERNNIVDDETLATMKNDDCVQITKIIDRKDGSYDITYNEHVRPLAKKVGYMAHIFHEFMVYEKDGDNNVSLDSGKTMDEAISKANELAKKNPGKEYLVRPKIFNQQHESEIAAVVGDKEYFKMLDHLTGGMEMTPAEAEEMLNTTGVSRKSRHRFYGNAMHRTGAAGYETDLMWVLNKHVNTTTRYVAMEGFKPAALSYFERIFGRFDNDYTNNVNAQYVKDYINDFNGNPTVIENVLNGFIHNSVIGKFVDNFDDRPAVSIESGITGTLSRCLLGFGNVSSAMMNMMQIINIAAITEDVEGTAKAFARTFKPSKFDQMLIDESGVLNDITGDTDSSGYSKNRTHGKIGMGKNAYKTVKNNINWLLDKGMYFFSKADVQMRKTAILAGYDKAMKDNQYAIPKGMAYSPEAMKYAKHIVNRKGNFIYGIHDTPNIMRRLRGTVIGPLAFMFMKYPVKQMELMAYLLERRSIKGNAIFWGGYIMMAGLLQFPGMDWLNDAITFFSGGRFNPKLEAKKYLIEQYGDNPFTRTAIYGVLANAGVDVSQRAGLANAFSGVLAGGPLTSVAAGVARSMANGNPIEAVKSASPGLGNVIQAVVGESRTTRGRKATAYDEWDDRLLKALGFRSIEESKMSDVKSIEIYERDRLTKEKQRAIDAFIKNQTSENAAKLKELGVKPQTVKDERKKKEMTSQERNTSSLSKKEKQQYNSLLEY